MSEPMTLVYCRSLGQALERLALSAEVKDSPALMEQVSQALRFYEQLAAELQDWQQEHQALRVIVSTLTREEGERICPPPRSTRLQS